MPKIKHLAIRTEDTGKLAQFYMDVFEMQMLHKGKDEGGAIFLTDGYFNLAILPNHEQNAPNGLYRHVRTRRVLHRDHGAGRQRQDQCAERALCRDPRF